MTSYDELFFFFSGDGIRVFDFLLWLTVELSSLVIAPADGNITDSE